MKDIEFCSCCGVCSHGYEADKSRGYHFIIDFLIRLDRYLSVFDATLNEYGLNEVEFRRGESGLIIKKSFFV